MSKDHKKVCAGCGEPIPGAPDDKFYLICSEECRDWVQSEVPEIIDQRHLNVCVWSNEWMRLNKMSVEFNDYPI